MPLPTNALTHLHLQAIRGKFIRFPHKRQLHPNIQSRPASLVLKRKRECELRPGFRMLASTFSLLIWLTSPALSQQPIGRTSAQEVKVSGAMDVHAGEMLLGNGSAVTAGDQPVRISLTRGGELRLCPTTTVHLSQDNSVEKVDSTALMMALDKGALEADYVTGKYSDVLMTPDFRILLSGPGAANVSVRVNAKGDTCVDNHGDNAPYVTVSGLFDGGVYRVRPNQRVLFEHGSLREVVDDEKELCGCPTPVSVASAGTSGDTPAAPGARVGGPSTTPSDMTFPLAVSQGLAPPPAKAETTPGEVHAMVTVPLTYNGATGKTGDPADLAVAGAAGAEIPPTPAPVAALAIDSKQVDTTIAATPEKKTHSESRGIFHRIGHFFSRVFGK